MNLAKPAWKRFAVASVVLCFFAQAALTQEAQPTRQRCRVEFQVMSTFGVPLKQFQLYITNRDSGLEVRPKFLTAGTLILEYGTYVVLAKASLHNRAERVVRVSQPTQVVILALPMAEPGDADDLYPPLRGRVVSQGEHSKRMIVRLMSLYGNYLAEAALTSDWSFVVPEAPYGDYLILLLDDQNIVLMQRFRHTVTRDLVMLEVK